MKIPCFQYINYLKINRIETERNKNMMSKTSMRSYNDSEVKVFWTFEFLNTNSQQRDNGISQ